MYALARTYITRSIPELLRRLDGIPTLSAGSHTVLFSVSPAPTANNNELSDLVTRLSTLPNAVGCLSAPIIAKPSHAAERVEDYTLCSFAIFDRQTATPFRSTIPGREAPQVGRWHAFRKGKDVGRVDDQDMDVLNGRAHQLPDGEVDWGRVWSQKETQYVHTLPVELQSLKADSVQSVLFFSDKSPEGLCNVLEASFTRASKLGLLAHSTPFLTGHPFTMFYNGTVVSSGAVGLCLQSAAHRARSIAVSFPDLQPVTERLTVTSSEGNLVHALDDKNPSRILLDAIERIDGDHKDKADTYYLGVHRPTLKSTAGHMPDQVYTIMSGDPSRGTLALEDEGSPVPGTIIQMYRRRAGTRPCVIPGNGLGFYTASPEGLYLAHDQFDPSDPDLVEIENTFVATSENGFVISRANGEKSEPIWKSTLPSGSVELR